MKKTLLMLFMSLFLLVGCNKADVDSTSTSSNDKIDSTPTTEYTQAQVKSMFRRDLQVFETKIKEKTKFSINGNLVAPDQGNTGMYKYVVKADADTFAGDGGLLDLAKQTVYMLTDVTTYLKADGVVSETPSSKQRMIKVPYLTDVTDYVLESDGKYSKTVDTGGNVVFNPLVQMIIKQLKTFSFEELPKDAYYTYEDGIYSIEFMFKDLEGTEIMEMINLVLGLFPELNETLMMYKDKVIINISNINLSTKKTTFDIKIKYPMMGAIFIEAISGEFNVLYNFNKVDTSTLPIGKTYYTVKTKGTTTVTSTMLNEETNDGVTTYSAGLVLNGLLGFKIPAEGEQIDLSAKTYEVKAPLATSIKFIDRLSGQELDIKDNRISIGILDNVLIELEYPESKSYEVTINEVAPIEGEII